MLPDETTRNSLLDQAESLLLIRKYAEAEAICRLVLKEEPDNLEAHFLLGTSAYHQKKWLAAVAHYRRSIASAPDVGFLYANLALALLEANRHKEAQVALDESIRLDGTTAVSHYHQGLIFQRTARHQEAREEYEHVISLDPRHIASWINLSATSLELGDTSRVIDDCHLALGVVPDNSALIGNLATAYGKEFRYDESLFQYQRLLQLIPQSEQAEVMGRMANVFSNAWHIEESISCFDKAISTSSCLAQKRALASTRLFVLHYSDAWTPEMIAKEHRTWGNTYFKPAQTRVFTNIPDAMRRLRIAYISPDLRIHAVVFFLQPILAAHDQEQVEIYCYSDVKKPDEVTRQLREQHGVIWRDVSGLDDETALQMILSDRIDIMVDLAGHSSENRLTLFALRVAPVQVSWIGYPDTTGLPDMDYRLTDPKADPPGMTEHLHTEELIRLPDSFLCYRPGSDFPDVNALPLFQNRFVTFGSFSNFIKVTPDTIDLWARILAAVPDSRLVLRSRGMTEIRFRKDILPIFERHSVTRERITILGHARSVIDNLQDYHQLDIALDTFPYHGTTTTCESLYMGVPVVTLAGRSHVSRVGCSLLHSVRLQELVADSPEQYYSIAVNLANSPELLQMLRNSLRTRLLASPLADNVTFTRHLEAAFRQIWQRWCAENSP